MHVEDLNPTEALARLSMSNTSDCPDNYMCGSSRPKAHVSLSWRTLGWTIYNPPSPPIRLSTHRLMIEESFAHLSSPFGIQGLTLGDAWLLMENKFTLCGEGLHGDKRPPYEVNTPRSAVAPCTRTWGKTSHFYEKPLQLCDVVLRLQEHLLPLVPICGLCRGGYASYVLVPRVRIRVLLVRCVLPPSTSNS